MSITSPSQRSLPALVEHLDALSAPLAALRADLPMLSAWGACVARRCMEGGRLLVAGNGGSAAQAQHLSAELVGRYLNERPALAAIALTADTSAVTAIGNDYGQDQIFARQVRAHGHPGDVLVLISTSGRSSNILEAAVAARRAGLLTFAMTGGRGNPLASVADEALCVEGPTPTVQEVHQVAIHLLCEAIDRTLAVGLP